MNTRRRLYSFMCLFLLALVSPAFAQSQDCTPNESWIAVGAGVPGEAKASAEMNGTIYVLHLMPNTLPDNKAQYQISSWNGTGWDAVVSFTLTFESQQGIQRPMRAFAAANGEFYLSGEFTAINDDTELLTFGRWNGSEWTTMAGTTLLRAVSAMAVHNGSLVASLNSNGNWWMMEWNGSDWTHIGGAGSQTSNKGPAYAIMSWNGDLYFGGERLELGTVSAMITKWDGSTWSTLGDPGYGVVRNMFVHNNQLHAAGPWLTNGANQGKMIIRWDGTEWLSDYPDVPRRNNFTSAIAIGSYGNQIYVATPPDSGRLEVALPRQIDRFDGTSWVPVSNFNGHVNFFANHMGSMYAGGAFTTSCGTPVGNFAMLCNGQNCGLISGNVFNDANGDCVQGSGENGLVRRLVEIMPGSHYAYTDKDGNYTRYVADGNYTVSLGARDHWNNTCPAAPGTHSVTITKASGVTGINFAQQAAGSVQDVAVSMISGRARQGRDLVYVITYENRGTMVANGTVKLFLDGILSYDSASVTPSRVNPGIVEWDYTGLQLDEIRTIVVHTTVPIATPMNTNICCRVEIDPSIIAFSTDDRDSTCVPVTGGYDPNDIRVTPYGIEQDGVISQDTKTLTYWVRFQNTGNDTAFNVTVTDQLSQHLDIASIRLGAASHPFTFSIDRDNNLSWSFANIMLPDSTASEPNSHGFFKFSVNLKPNLPADTRISNFVDIYFDYNTPVRTNTVTSTISALMGVDPVAAVASLAVYPNPARGLLTLTGDLRTGTVVKLRTILGQEVASYRHDGSGRMTIDASALPAGMYLLEAETANGMSVQRVSVVR